MDEVVKEIPLEEIERLVRKYYGGKKKEEWKGKEIEIDISRIKEEPEEEQEVYPKKPREVTIEKALRNEIKIYVVKADDKVKVYIKPYTELAEGIRARLTMMEDLDVRYNKVLGYVLKKTTTLEDAKVIIDKISKWYVWLKPRVNVICVNIRDEVCTTIVEPAKFIEPLWEVISLKKIKPPEHIRRILERVKEIANKSTDPVAINMFMDVSMQFITDDTYSSKEKEGFAVYENEEYYCRFIKRFGKWEYDCYEK
ncbi:MAG: hypothetical protein QXU89_04255 [Desulfurococcaceae archaeon]